MWQGNDRGGPVGDAAQDSKQRGTKDPDQDGTVDFSRHQNQCQPEAEAGGLHRPIGEATEPDESGGVGNYQFCVPHADERDEHANPGGRRMLQAIGHAIDDLLPNTGHREYQKEAARKEHHSERRTPRDVHAETNGVGEIRIE
jgi:hypothetical protein